MNYKSFRMELVLRVALFLTGIVNILPTLGAFVPSKMKDAYGIDMPDANFELLLRHRAVLFGIVGGFMLYSAITKNHLALASIIGLMSMVSFLILYVVSAGHINEALTKVMKIDVMATAVLLIAYLVYHFMTPN
jgi:ABC-type microcin C transport system permease subunit YejB